MSDEEYRRALREHDERALKYAVRTLSDEVIKAEVERIRREKETLSLTLRLLVKEAATCFCGALVPCMDRELVYARALKAHELYNNTESAIQLMKVTVCTKKGVCQFPPCDRKTETDYDGGHYVWCPEHNEMFSGLIPMFSKQKGRGGS